MATIHCQYHTQALIERNLPIYHHEDPYELCDIVQDVLMLEE